ncbi:MAG: hypothetical protein JXA87_09880 [Thermoleophilia bacterium]|nr:hypothetical protein [Thermoleophilia bacterium]
MTLRLAQHFGYRINDLAWLKLRELEYLYADEGETRPASVGESDAAFTI